MMSSKFICHCGLAFVIAGLTRNPVVAWHSIPDQVRDDSLKARDDSTLSWLNR